MCIDIRMRHTGENWSGEVWGPGVPEIVSERWQGENEGRAQVCPGRALHEELGVTENKESEMLYWEDACEWLFKCLSKILHRWDSQGGLAKLPPLFVKNRQCLRLLCDLILFDA